VNFGRVAAAALVAWIAYLAISPLVNNVLMADLYAQHARVFRPRAEMNVAFGLAATLLGFFVFAYAYAKGYEGGAGAVEGLRYGVIVGLLLATFSVAWNYVVLPVSGALAAAWIVDAIVEMAIYGAVVGLIYKPHGGRK
jgi:phosphotransferase system  glucose/maltose/N-acetylglucosamine-specific IIC component